MRDQNIRSRCDLCYDYKVTSHDDARENVRRMAKAQGKAFDNFSIYYSCDECTERFIEWEEANKQALT